VPIWFAQIRLAQFRGAGVVLSAARAKMRNMSGKGFEENRVRPLRSRTSTHGRNMAGARSLWRATGMKSGDFGKPIVAVANSFTQFVPGHVHLKDIGQLVARSVERAGGVAKEFNTIAVDDGIAMGHDGMLYSLPSRDLIADSVEYMVNAHCADALVCISNCDKITPGMLMAAMRLNIPAVFVSGGPMEAGQPISVAGVADKPLNLVDAINYAANDAVSDDDLERVEKAACPTCGACSGMFTANSMNSLTEAMGLSLPGNGSTLATHTARRELYEAAGELIVTLCRRFYDEGDDLASPRGIATKAAFENAMALDVAMGGSTNTVLHILATAQEAGVDFTLADIEEISKKVPTLSKVAPNHPIYHMEHVHRAGGIPALLGELDRAGLLNHDVTSIHTPRLRDWLDDWDIRGGKATKEAFHLFSAAPGGKRTTESFANDNTWDSLDTDAQEGCIRDVPHAYTREGGLTVLRGNLAPDGAVFKTAGVDPDVFQFKGKALVTESQEDAVDAILNGRVQPGHVLVVRYEGPSGGPGMQEMLYPTSFIKGKGLGKQVALVTDGRFSGGSSGISVGHVSPEADAGGVIGLVHDGDEIEIDVDARSIKLNVSDEELAKRRKAMEAQERPWHPVDRRRVVTPALRAYAAMATSADRGAVRDLSRIGAWQPAQLNTTNPRQSNTTHLGRLSSTAGASVETSQQQAAYPEAVYALVRQIPRGRVMTYGLIAEILREELGYGGPRVVGNVMAEAGFRLGNRQTVTGAGPVVGPAQDNFDLPWWRVVNVAGSPPRHYLTAALAALQREHTPLKKCGTKVDVNRSVWFPGIDK